MTYDASRGTISGSVLQADGTPVLLDCNVTEVLTEEFVLDCFSAGPSGWEHLSTIGLSRSFLDWPADPALIHSPQPTPLPTQTPAAPQPSPVATTDPTPSSGIRLWLIGQRAEAPDELLLVRSDDSGSTWTAAQAFPFDGTGDLHFLSASTGWLVLTPSDRFGDGQLWRTVDGGETWTNETASLPSAPETAGLPRRIGGISFADADRGIIATHFVRDRGVHSLVGYTTDGGASWHAGSFEPTRQTPPSTAYSGTCMTPDGFGFATGN